MNHGSDSDSRRIIPSQYHMGMYKRAAAACHEPWQALTSYVNKLSTVGRSTYSMLQWNVLTVLTFTGKQTLCWLVGHLHTCRYLYVFFSDISRYMCACHSTFRIHVPTWWFQLPSNESTHAVTSVPGVVIVAEPRENYSVLHIVMNYVCGNNRDHAPTYLEWNMIVFTAIILKHKYPSV